MPPRQLASLLMRSEEEVLSRSGLAFSLSLHRASRSTTAAAEGETPRAWSVRSGVRGGCGGATCRGGGVSVKATTVIVLASSLSCAVISSHLDRFRRRFVNWTDVRVLGRNRFHSINKGSTTFAMKPVIRHGTIQR